MANGKAATLKILGNNLDAKEKLKQIKEEADKLREDNPELTVKINRAQAAAEMAVLKEQLKGVRDEALEAEAAVDSVGKSSSLANFKKAIGGVDTAGLGSGALWGAGIAAAAGPGIAAVGVLGAGIVGLGASLGTAGVGLGLFAKVAQSEFTNLGKNITGMTKALGEFDKARTAPQIAQATKDQQAALKGLSAAQQDLVFNAADAEDSWHSFLTKSADGVDRVLAPALGLLPKLLGNASELLPGVEGALTGIVGKIGTGLSSPGWQRFIDDISNAAPDAINSLAGIVGHLGHMAGEAFDEFLPLGNEILDFLDKSLAKGDAKFAGGLQEFMGWLSSHGPEVLGILKNLGITVGNVGKSFIGLGQLDIGAFSGIASLLATISKNPIGAGALVGLLVLTKVGSAIGPLVKMVTAFKELSGVINITKIALIGLDAVPIVLIISAIIIAIVLLVTHWNTVRSVAVKVWHDITGAVSAAFNWVKKNWPLLLGILLGPIALAAALIITHWHQIESGAESLLGKLESFFKSLPSRILGALGDLGHLLWNAGVSILNGFLGGLIQKWDDVKNFVGGIASWIGAHKGPIEVDALLLRPHGRAIMGGLVGGLADGMPGLTSQLSRTTNVIANTRVPSVSGAGGAGALTAEWIGGAGADQGFISWLKENIRIRGGDPGVIGR